LLTINGNILKLCDEPCPRKGGNAFLTGKSSKKRAGGSKRAAANPRTMPNPIVAPDFYEKYSLT
jgi:hypothetical protein